MDGVFALSVADEVEKYGAYLAVASFIGLAALSILYFSQARELRRLREWAGRAPERAADLQDRVVAQASEAARRVQAQPVVRAAPPKPPVAVTAKPAVAGAAVAAAPGDPAAVVAPDAPAPPAESGAGNGVAATPDGDAPPAEGDKPADAEPETGDTAGVVKETADSHPKSSPPDGEEAVAPPAPALPAVPAAPMAPSTAAAREAAAVPPDLGETTEFDISETDPVKAPPPLPPRRSAPAARAGAAPLRASAPTASPRRPGQAPVPEKSGRSTWPIVAGVVVALGAGVFGATQLLGEDEKPLPNKPAPANPGNETATQPEDSSSSDTSSSSGTTKRGDVTVAVLNGTTTTGLAAKVADKVENAGFARGATGNNADQQRAASQVFYADGKKSAARDVAKLLGIGEVLPLDVNTRGLAGENAAVVVVVGSDQSTQ